MSSNRKLLVIAIITISLFFVVISTIIIVLSTQRVSVEIETSTKTLSYPLLQPSYPVSQPKNVQIVSYGEGLDFFNFSISIPTINMAKPIGGVINGSLLMNSANKVEIVGDFGININTPEGVTLHLGATPEAVNPGFQNFIPEYDILTNSNLGSDFYRVKIDENEDLKTLKSILGEKDSYYYYTKTFLPGSDCQVQEGNSCTSRSFSVNTKDSNQSFVSYCGINFNSEVRICDEIFSGVRIEEILRK